MSLIDSGGVRIQFDFNLIFGQNKNTLKKRKRERKKNRARQHYQRPKERNNILFHSDIAILRYPLINYATTLRKLVRLPAPIYLLLRTLNLFLRERRSINIASTGSLNLNRINILTVSTTDRNAIHHRREIGRRRTRRRVQVYQPRYRPIKIPI